MFKNRFRAFLLFNLLLFPLLAFAQEQDETPAILVTATKHETSLSNVSTSATVITRQEMQQKGHKNAVEALRDILAFDITQSGGPGGLSYPQMRGLTGKFIVIMIDGVRVNDPSDAQGGVGTQLTYLTTGDIERIEVVRGSQSPLYGSNAAAGVINIITRSGQGDGELKMSYEGGSLNSHRFNIDYSVKKGGFKFRAGQAETITDGIIDLETYNNHTTSVKLGYEKKDAFDWETLVRYTKVKHKYAELLENYDSQYGGAYWSVQLPDPNQENDNKYTTISNRLKHFIRDSWQHEFNFGLSVLDRHTADKNDGQLGTMSAPYDNFTLDWTNFYNKGQAVPVYDTPWGASDYTYKGTNYDLDYRHTFLLSGDNVSDVLTAGFGYVYQKYDQKGTSGQLADNLYTASLYFHNQTLFLEDALSLNAGMRYDNHKETDASTTGMVGLAWDIRQAGLILRANAGSAFRAPAIYELFSPNSGNLDLNPETSTSFEFGIEKYALDKKFRLSLGYWFTKVDDLIIYVMTDPATWAGHYENFDEAESKGVEAALSVKPHRNWRFGLNYTYTDSRKYDKGKDAWSRNVQLPFNKFNLNATWLYKEASVSLDGYWVDDSRLRWNGIDRMDSYFKLDLTGRAPLGRHFAGTLRLRNILDKDYYEGMGYRVA
ncbi:MAG: TonB-dependent receptor, partial [Gemmatimonadota bacterium]|nr:TonB-dependent receptor [Gemmatimonadota bacterium]